MADGEVKLRFSAEGAERIAADTIALANALGKIEAASRRLGENLSKIPSVDIRFSGDVEKTANDCERIANALARIPDEVKIAPFRAEDIEALSKGMSLLNERLETLDKKFSDIEEAASDADDEFDDIEDTLDDVGEEAIEASGRIGLLGRAMEKVKDAGARMGLSLNVVKRGVTVAFGAIAAGIAGATAGMTRAIYSMDKVAKQARNIGVNAKDVIVLKEAFKQSGLESVNLGYALGKMQRKIVDGNKGFQMLGLNVEKLRGKSAIQQFEAIGEAVRKITNQEQRAAALMAIFEEQGVMLNSFFSDAGVMQSAAKTLGSTAQIMGRQSAAFERAGTLLGSISTKFEGLFVGMASNFIDPLSALLEKLNSLDFARYGREFTEGMGAWFSAFVGVFTSGNFVNVVKYPFERAAMLVMAKFTSWASEFSGFMTGDKSILKSESDFLNRELELQERGFDMMIKDIINSYNSSFPKIAESVSQTVGNVASSLSAALSGVKVGTHGSDSLSRVGGFLGTMPVGARKYEQETARNTKRIADLIEKQQRIPQNFTAVYS